MFEFFFLSDIQDMLFPEEKGAGSGSQWGSTRPKPNQTGPQLEVEEQNLFIDSRIGHNMNKSLYFLPADWLR